MPARIIDVDFHHRHRVRWCETDASGFVHFANYVRYMEETEYAFLRSRGLSIVMQDQRGTIGFPRVATEFEIQTAAGFDDQLDIWMQLADNDGIKLTFRFEIARGPDVVCLGKFDVACCRFLPGHLPRAILIPDFFLERLPMG